MDIPAGYLDPSQTQYNNVSGSDLGIQPTYTGAPSWWDNITNELSADAENIWNDVEAAGVWAGNEISGFVQDLECPTCVPGNPISQGYAAGSQTRATIGQDIQDFGSTIGNALANAGTPLILLGLVGVAAFVILEKD